jgi:hypothetical protein
MLLSSANGSFRTNSSIATASSNDGFSLKEARRGESGGTSGGYRSVLELITALSSVAAGTFAGAEGLTVGFRLKMERKKPRRPMMSTVGKWSNTRLRCAGARRLSKILTRRCNWCAFAQQGHVMFQVLPLHPSERKGHGISDLRHSSRMYRHATQTSNGLSLDILNSTVVSQETDTLTVSTRVPLYP